MVAYNMSLLTLFELVPSIQMCYFEPSSLIPFNSIHFSFGFCGFFLCWWAPSFHLSYQILLFHFRIHNISIYDMAAKQIICSAICIAHTVFQFQFCIENPYLVVFVLFYPQVIFSHRNVSSIYTFLLSFGCFRPKIYLYVQHCMNGDVGDWRLRKEEKKYSPCLRCGYEDLQKENPTYMRTTLHSPHTHIYIRNEKTNEKNMKIMECWKPNETKWKNRGKRIKEEKKKKSTEMIQDKNG